MQFKGFVLGNGHIFCVNYVDYYGIRVVVIFVVLFSSGDGSFNVAGHYPYSWFIDCGFALWSGRYLSWK